MPSDHVYPGPHGTAGITLLDYYAGMAMNGILSGRSPGHRQQAVFIAEDAYGVAEAMMRERERRRANNETS